MTRDAIVAAIDAEQLPPQDTALGYMIEIHGRSNRIMHLPDGAPYLAGRTRGCVGMRACTVGEAAANTSRSMTLPVASAL